MKYRTKTLTIHDIAALLPKDNYFFSPETMEFFGQSMSDFRVQRINEYVYFIIAPSYYRGKRLGLTQRYFDTRTNSLTRTHEELEHTND